MHHCTKTQFRRWGRDATGPSSLRSTARAATDSGRGRDVDASVRRRETTRARIGTLNLWARHGLTGRLGVRYGDTPDERLDVFRGEPRGPVVVFLHGGDRASGSAADFSFVALGLVTAGATVVVVDSVPCPTVAVGEVTRRLGAAMAWTRRHIAAFGADPSRIAVVGHSAGGRGAAMLASTDWPGSYGLEADVVKGYCTVSGLFDSHPPARTDRAVPLHPTAAPVVAVDPMPRPPVFAAPMLVTYGLDQNDDLMCRSVEFAARWRNAGLSVQAWARPRLDQDDELLALIYADSDLTTRVLALTEGRLVG